MLRNKKAGETVPTRFLYSKALMRIIQQVRYRDRLYRLNG